MMINGIYFEFSRITTIISGLCGETVGLVVSPHSVAEMLHLYDQIQTFNSTDSRLYSKIICLVKP